MHCSEFDQFLELESDGPLSNAAAAHLDECSNCRILWHDLVEIRTASLDWGAEEPLPPARVWIALRARLESEGLIHEPTALGWFAWRSSSPASNVGWFQGWFGWSPKLALAGASFSLLLVAAALFGIQGVSPDAVLVHRNEPLASLPRSASPAELNRTLDGEMKLAMSAIPRQEYSVTTSLEENLGIVDNLIAVCEKSVREQPDNQMARDYLYGAYQQKAVLLTTAMDHGTLEGR